MPSSKDVAETMISVIVYVFPSWMLKHPGDYILHFSISAIGVLTLSYVLTVAGMLLEPAVAISVIALVCVGIGKELLDQLVSSFSYGDLAADTVGIIVGAWIAIFLL